MAEASFPVAHKHVLAYEGGYSNHPNDPGGVTLNGVIQRVYDAWRAAHGRTKRPLTRAMEGTAEWIAERDAIFRGNYWIPVGAPELEPGVDGASYDYAVNSGVGRASKVLQRLCGATVDGKVGPKTIAAANAKDPEALAHAICMERKAFYEHLATSKPKLRVFLKGWLRRDASVDAYTRILAVNFKASKKMPAPEPGKIDAPVAKGEFPEPKNTKRVVKGSGPAIAAEEAARAPTSWTDWIAAHPAETALIVAGAVVVVVIAVRLITLWHKRRQEAPVPGFDYGIVPDKA